MATLGVEIAAMLAARGIDRVFGIPGVHNIELYRGIEIAGLTHILARHEQGAGFMADGYARATGRPGVVFVISGPGLTNVMTPMGQAWSDSVPMLVISTVLDDTAGRQGQLHQMRDQEGAARTVCSWSETARTPQAAFALIDRALAEFEIARPRPKHIQIPLSVLTDRASAPKSDSARHHVPGPLEAVVKRIAEALEDARRPALLFGGGARDAGRPLCTELARRAGALSFTTYAGRGLVDARHDLHLGAMLARPGSAEVLARADLLLVVGSDLAEVDFWREVPGHHCPVFRIDIDPVVLASTCGDNVECVATPAAPLLREVLDALEGHDAWSDWNAAEVSALRERWRAEVDAEFPGVLPVCAELAEALPDDTMIYSDMTQFAYAAKEVWDMPRPGHWHHPTGFGTLGYALPAAIGGALGHGGPVLAIAGDYGFQYTLPELGVATELGLSLPVLLWDNEGLKQIEEGMVEAQFAPVGVTVRNPDWAQLAGAYGCGFSEPTGMEALVAAVLRGFKAGRPTLIRVTPGLSSSS